MKIHPYYFSKTKRVFDVILASCLVIGLAPLFFSVSATILLTAGWPITFTQRRFGQHKKPFWLYKFRVMYVGADKYQWRYRKQNQAPEPMYKNWNDPRYVGIGKWLSRTGLDELPQLLNILKGEMSFVGPRPLPIKEAEQLDKNWDFRYEVKPGVFSEWSVSSERHLSLLQWRRLEKLTLLHSSLFNDLKLILSTTQLIFLGS